MVRFSKLDENGSETDVRVISNFSIAQCPSFILIAEHYRPDGTCRHDEVICEYKNCTKPKYRNEIFCRKHLCDI